MVSAVSTVAIRQASKPIKSNFTSAALRAESKPARLIEPLEANFSS